MNRFGHVIITTILSVVIVSSRAGAQMPGYLSKAAKPATTETVSILQLIASPERYDGRRVQLVGFLRLEFEGNAIYLHREDYERSILPNALSIELPNDMTKQQVEAVNMQYVICLGTFVAAPRGRRVGMESGTIKDVMRLQVWPSAAETERMSKGLAQPQK